MDALGFMRSQTRLIRNRVYALRYPDVDFATFVPVSPPPEGNQQWATGIEHYSSDMVGTMIQISPQTTELPMVDLTHDQHLVRVAEWGASIGYNWFEMQQALMVGDTAMMSKKEAALRRAYDQTHWNLVMKGRTDLGWNGLINNSAVTSTDASAEWSGRTASSILQEINEQIEGVYTSTNTVDMADTMYLPVGVQSVLSSKFIDSTSDSLMSMIIRNNVYTMKTGQPLRILELRGLEDALTTAVNGSKKRAIFFRNSIDVLEYHLIMPLTLYELYRTGSFHWVIPAITRTGGLEVKLPSSMRYLDGI